jgi:hypothetical protein
MYFNFYDYVFSLHVYVWLHWLRFFPALSSVVRQYQGKTRKDEARPALFLIFVLFCLFFVLFYVLFVLCRSLYCSCVLNYCHRLATQLQLNI